MHKGGHANHHPDPRNTSFRLSYPFLVFLPLLISFTFSCSLRQADSPRPFTIGLEGSPINLDPRLSTDAYSARVIQIVYNGLLKMTPESTLIGDLAERWEMPDDTAYIFYLRKGVTFHDGQNLTAEDVKFTFTSLLDPDFPSPLKESYAHIDRIEVLSPYIIKFQLKETFAPFLVNMTLGIIPRHVAEKANHNLSFHPVGTGPFKLIEWKSDDSLTFQAFPEYFEGPPKLSTVVYRIIPDEAIRLLELKKGNIDLLQNALSPDAIQSLRDHPDIKLIQKSGTNYTYVGFNLEDPILQNRMVREAIALAINREAIIEHLLGNLAEPATGVLAPSNWAYEPDVAIYDYNPQKATWLLDEAGFPDPDGQGPRQRLSLLYKTSQNELSKRVAEVIQQNLNEVGIHVEILSYEWGTFFSDIKSGNFQLYSLQWVGITEPDIYYYLFHSSSIPPSGANRGRYMNPKLDNLLEKGRKILDPEERRKIYSQVQKIIAFDLPYVNLWYQTNMVTTNKRVQGFVPFPAGDFTSLKKVYLAPPVHTKP
ncbi:MAG: ABC transporter substrate-binding protein [bacterium]